MTDSAASTPLPAEGGQVALLTSPVRTRLVLAGSLDVTTNRELATAVEEALRVGLPVDVVVRDITFMDSSVVAMLARLAYRLPARPRVIQPPDIVSFLLDVTNIGEVVDVLTEDPGFPPPADEVTAPGA